MPKSEQNFKNCRATNFPNFSLHHFLVSRRYQISSKAWDQNKTDKTKSKIRITKGNLFPRLSIRHQASDIQFIVNRNECNQKEMYLKIICTRACLLFFLSEVRNWEVIPLLRRALIWTQSFAL